MMVDTRNIEQVQNCIERVLDDNSLQDVLEILANICYRKAGMSMQPGTTDRWDRAGVAINRLGLSLPTSL